MAAVHAFLHREEGVQWNAEYWYRQAGRPPFTGSLEDEWVALAGELGLSRVALVYADSEFPREVADGVRASIRALEMELVFDEAYPEDKTEFSGLAERIIATQPEVLLGGTYLEDSIGLVRAAKKAGLSPKIFAMTVGPAFREFGDALGEDTEGIMGTVAWMRSGNLPMAYDFSYRYKQKFGANASAQSAYGYAAGQVLEAAVRLADSLDQGAVAVARQGGAQVGEGILVPVTATTALDTGSPTGGHTGAPGRRRVARTGADRDEA